MKFELDDTLLEVPIKNISSDNKTSNYFGKLQK
jgi:hypothetical protein